MEKSMKLATLLAICSSFGCQPEQPLVSSKSSGKVEAVSNSASTQASASERADDRKVPAPTPIYTYRVVRAYPHDPNAFTQGLVYQDGYLYEGTGLKGASTIRRVELTSGRVLKKQPIDSIYFGEGIVLWKGKLIEITWQSKIGFIYDQSTFKKLGSFKYDTEGWGLTHDGKRIIMSDGTSTLYFRDPETLAQTGTLQVTDQGNPVVNLNELEYIKGEIWANVWRSDRIARIDPKSGKVTGWIDLSGLLKPEYVKPGMQPDVLNGISYDEAKNRIFVTGKLWPKLFEIELFRIG